MLMGIVFQLYGILKPEKIEIPLIFFMATLAVSLVVFCNVPDQTTP